MIIHKAKLIKDSVKHSILKLLNLARSSYTQKNISRSKRYVQMALDLVRKNKVSVPPEGKNSFCKKCNSIWIPNETALLVFDAKRSLLRISCKCGFTKAI